MNGSWLRLYMTLWLCEKCVTFNYKDARDWLLLLSASVSIASNWRWCTCLALMVSCTKIIEKIPMVWPSWWWCLQTDGALLWYLLCDRQEEIRSLMRKQLALFYLGAGIAKLNTSYLNPRSSCATVFMLQLTSYYLRPEWQFMDGHIVNLAPVVTMIWEIFVGVAMLFNWQQSAAFTSVALHAAISATPPPNGISTFSAKVAPRVLSCVEPAVVHKLDSYIYILFVPVYAALMVTSYIKMTHLQDRALTAFAPAALLVLVLVYKQDTRESKQGSHCRVGRSFFLVLAFCNAFLGPLTGLQDLGAPVMYSNYKLHGGSNHYFLPTALITEKVTNHQSSPFYGGIIRIESTSASTIRRLYPNELELEPRNLIYGRLEAVDYFAPRFFNGAKGRVLGAASNIPPHAFTPFTVPAFEFRRLLDDASRMDSDFNITFARLPGSRGDELWRSTAVDSRLIVEYRKGQIHACRRLYPEELPCTKADAALLHTQNKNFLFFLLRKLYLALPYPVILLPPSTSNNTSSALVLSSPPPEILCFGP